MVAILWVSVVSYDPMADELLLAGTAGLNITVQTPLIQQVVCKPTELVDVIGEVEVR